MLFFRPHFLKHPSLSAPFTGYFYPHLCSDDESLLNVFCHKHVYLRILCLSLTELVSFEQLCPKDWSLWQCIPFTWVLVQLGDSLMDTDAIHDSSLTSQRLWGIHLTSSLLLTIYLLTVTFSQLSCIEESNLLAFVLIILLTLKFN